MTAVPPNETFPLALPLGACASLTPVVAPQTDRLLRTMGYRIVHGPEDGYTWTWHHPRHRQNNRWYAGMTHVGTADQAWQDALSDALQAKHPRSNDLLRTVMIEREQDVLRDEASAVEASTGSAPSAPADPGRHPGADGVDSVATSSPWRRARPRL